MVLRFFLMFSFVSRVDLICNFVITAGNEQLLLNEVLSYPA